MKKYIAKISLWSLSRCHRLNFLSLISTFSSYCSSEFREGMSSIDVKSTAITGLKRLKEAKMGRRGDFVFIISVLLLVSPMAYAWDFQASVNIGSIYETNGADFILSILNPQGNDESINKL